MTPSYCWYCLSGTTELTKQMQITEAPSQFIPCTQPISGFYLDHIKSTLVSNSEMQVLLKKSFSWQVLSTSFRIYSWRNLSSLALVLDFGGTTVDADLMNSFWARGFLELTLGASGEGFSYCIDPLFQTLRRCLDSSSSYLFLDYLSSLTFPSHDEANWMMPRQSLHTLNLFLILSRWQSVMSFSSSGLFSAELTMNLSKSSRENSVGQPGLRSERWVHLGMGIHVSVLMTQINIPLQINKLPLFKDAQLMNKPL